MTGCRFSMKGLASAINAGKIVKLAVFAAFALMLQTLVMPVGASAGVKISQIASKASNAKDTDGLSCFNRNQATTQGVGFFEFTKSTESSSRSNFFTPKIRVRYTSWGWIPFTSDYYTIQNTTADLGSNECSRLIGIRFCARYAGPAGTELKDGTVLDKAQPGYDPGSCACRPECSTADGNSGDFNKNNSPCCSTEDYDEPNNTCCAVGDICHDPATNSIKRQETCVSPLRTKLNVTRLCAYEDAWDLADLEEGASPFHHMDDVCAKYTDKDAKQKCIDNAVANYATQGAMTGLPAMYFGPGFGLLVMGLMAAIGAIIGAITGGAMNYDVMTTTPGKSLGCVDVPMAPGPPAYFYTLQPGPPWPQVFTVSDVADDFKSELAKYPTLSSSAPVQSSANNPEHWRFEKNEDWFYPKIGVMLGETELQLQADGSQIYVQSTKRATRVLTGDFYAEGSTGDLAGVGRYAPLPSLNNQESGDNTQKHKATIGIDVDAGNGDIKRVEYQVATEVYNDKVCAYVIGGNDNTKVNNVIPGTDKPELIGCVARPRSYYAMYTDTRTPSRFSEGDLIKGVPYPQIFHPWYIGAQNANYPSTLVAWGPEQAVQSYASTYNEIKFIWWLAHDPRNALVRNPGNTSGYDIYEEYKADDSENAHRFKANKVSPSTQVNLPQLGCDGFDIDNAGNIVIPIHPVTGEQIKWTSSFTNAAARDYFKRDVNRNHRIHGAVYCVENYDKDKNGRIDVTDTDMCASYIGEGQRLERLERPNTTPVGYVEVKFTGKIKIPNETPRELMTSTLCRDQNTKAVTGSTPCGGGSLPSTNAQDMWTTFNGTVRDVNNQVINAVNGVLDSSGNYKNGVRFYSTDRNLGCSMKVNPGTKNIELDLAGCKQENVNGTNMYYRDPPDPLRGELIITNADGQTRLVRRKYGNAASESDTYPTKLATESYDAVVKEVIGQCPLVASEDGMTFTPKMLPNGCCDASAGTCPEGTNWVAPAARKYTMPDLLRGETVRKSDQFEEGFEKGYCVTTPPSGCPSLNIIGADGNHVWAWNQTFAKYSESDVPVFGKGIGDGACMPGYGGAKLISGSGISAVYSTTEGVYGELPLRECNPTTNLFSTQGEWGNIIRPCLPLYCHGNHTTCLWRDRDCLGELCTPYRFKCHWGKTQAGRWASDGDCDECNGPACTGGAHSEWRIKYCDMTGQWKGYTFRGNDPWPSTGSEAGGGNYIGDSGC